MKSVGWIIGLLVVVAVVVYFAASRGGSKAPAGPATGAQKPVTAAYGGVALTYQKLSGAVLPGAKEYESAVASGVAAERLPTSPYGRFVRDTMTDTGTVLRSTEAAGRGTAFIDMDGDGQAEVELDLGTSKAPANGSKVTFAAEITQWRVAGGKVVFAASVKTLTEVPK